MPDFRISPESIVLPEVGNVDKALGAADAPQRSVWKGLEGTLLALPFDKARITADCAGLKTIIVIGEEKSMRRVAQTHGPLDHRVKHRREFARRGVDDLQYLGG